jgi:ABC-2 type transport system ATP-binding protein
VTATPGSGLATGAGTGQTGPVTSQRAVEQSYPATAAAQDLVVRVERLSVRFGAVDAVREVDLSVAPGGSVALVGRNGAGKSTTLRVLAGVVPATGGRVVVGGVDARRDPQAVKHLTGYCPDVGGLVPRSTPWEHLQLAARLRGLTGWEPRATDLLERFDLADVADRVTAGFSHGMGRRLSVVLAAFHSPAVLLLDEPFDGVDPLGVDATLALVEAERAAGTAVLVSTHLVSLAARACVDAVVLRGGEVAGRVPAAALTGDKGELRYRAMLA